MLTLVIVTLGLYILVNSLAGWIWGFGNRGFPSMFGDGSFDVAGVRISVESIGIVAVLIAVVGILFAVFQRTKVGLAMRAVSLNPDSSRLVGISVGRTLMIGWGIAALVGALAGALIAPRLFLDVNFMGGVLIYSFAAATLGGFDSPFGAVLGGWIIGIAENLAGTYIDFIGSDLKILVPLVAILVVLLFRPDRPVRLGGGGQGMSPKRIRMAGWALVIVLAVLLPFFFGTYRVGQFTQAMALAIAVLGLNLLVGYSGQISLGHGAFFALGAYTSAISIIDLGVPVPAHAAAGRVRVRDRRLPARPPGAAAARALPRARSRSASRSPRRRSSSAPRGSRAARRGSASTRSPRRRGRGWPTTSGCTSSRSSVAAAMFVLAAFLVRGRVGRALVAIRDNEIAARTMGVDLARYKTGTFAVSAAYAGVGGALFTLPIGFLAPESFPLALSFAFLAAIVVGGLATIAGALFGALFIEFVPVYAADVDEALAGVIYGGVLILFMYLLPGGVMGLVRKLSSATGRRGRTSSGSS